MDPCQQARDWLLQADEPRPERCPVADVAAHVKACSDCGALVERIRQLESAWRKLPAPGHAQAAQAAFLRRVAEPAPIPRPYAPEPRWKRLLRSSRRLAVAALVLLALGMGWWLLFPGADVQAHDVVASLIDWNLTLAQAGSAEERQQIYAEREPFLKVAFSKAALSDEERRLAQTLFDHGLWLRANTDPLAQTDIFTDMADLLLDHMYRVSKKGSARDMNRYARQYRRIMEKIDANLDKLGKAPALE